MLAVNAGSAVESEIRSAVHAGKEVSIHQSAVSHYGWSGHGYIIIDPETGSGAYKISGGANGSETQDEGQGLESSALTGLLQGLLELANGKWTRIVGQLFDFFDLITNSLDAAENCHSAAAAVGMVWTYRMGAIAWTAYSLLWCPLSVWLALVIFVAGAILLALAWASDIENCRARPE